MSYLLKHYAEGGKHWVRLDREEGLHNDHVLSARLTEGELMAFIEMCRKLDPATRVEQSPVPELGRRLTAREVLTARRALSQHSPTSHTPPTS
jgi:hypothetical protein